VILVKPSSVKYLTLNYPTSLLLCCIFGTSLRSVICHVEIASSLSSPSGFALETFNICLFRSGSHHGFYR
jgi:hypothetical protein